MSEQTPDATTDQTSETVLHTESHDPAVPAAYSAFMRQGWGDRELELPPHPITSYAAARRQRLSEAFPGERLVLPAGSFKVRSYDTDYRFRPDTAHTYFCGNQTSDAVLVVDGGESILYARPRSNRDTDEFFRDRQYGELWVGRRPSLKEISDSLGLEVRHIDQLGDDLTRGGKTRVHRGVSETVDKLVAADESRDADFARVASEMRLLKDEWEVAELQTACDITTLGFTDSVAEWDRVLEFGERWVEGTFFRRARAMGNDIGYDSIVGGGSHATTLHWIDNTGPINRGELVLLDMGVEGHNLYTADVTRTLPIDGTFTSLQRELYDLVYAAQEAGIKAVRPGAAFTDPHNAAMVVLAHGLEAMSLLPVLGGGGPRPRVEGLRALDAAWGQPHARDGRARLRPGVTRGLQQGHPRRGHGADRRAGPVLPVRRPAGARGDARDRHPDRGRHPRHRRRLPEPLRGPPPHVVRRRGVDGVDPRLTRRTTGRPAVCRRTSRAGRCAGHVP